MFKDKLVTGWKKFGAKVVLAAAVMAPVVGITVAYAADGDYSKSAISNAVSTAFVDAQQAVDVGSYSKGSGDSKSGDKSGGDAKTGSADDSVATQADLNNRAAQIVNAGNFGNFGLVYGASDQSARAILSTINNPTSVSNSEIASFNSLTGNAATQYHTFGLAMTRLMSQAKKMKPEAISNAAAMDSWNESVMKLSNFGMKILKKWNPAPVVLAFIDDSELNAASNAENGFIQMIRDDANFSGIVHLFGAPVSVGSVTVSRSFLVLVSVNLLILIYGLIARLANGMLLDDSIRRVIVTTLSATAGIVLGARMLTMGVNWFADISNDAADQKNTNIVEKHLNLSDWYATSFSIPANVSLNVKNGSFALTREDVRAINHHTYSIVTGRDGSDEEVAERIISAAQTDNNETAVNFNTAVRKNGQPWATNKIFEVAEAVASKPKEDISADALSAGYIDVGKQGLRGSGDAKSAQYTMAGASNYGMSPIAAYQMLRTSFDKNGWAVKSNTATVKIPSVAISVAGSTGATKAPPLVRFVASIAMVLAAIKAFISIITSGFGGVFKGGGLSAIGSPAGAGELVGGVIALVGGLFGIGLIMGLSMSIMDAVYSIINDLLNSNSGSGLVESAMEPLLSGLRTQSIMGINWGDALADLFVNIGTFIVSMIALFSLPKIAKIPIEGFGQYMSGLPGSFAQRAQGMANDFINGRHLAGNGPLSQLGASRGGFGGGGGTPGGIAGALGAGGSGVKDSAKSLASAGSVLGAYALGKMASIAEGDENIQNDGDEREVDQTNENGITAEESLAVEGNQEAVENVEDDTDVSEGGETDIQAQDTKINDMSVSDQAEGPSTSIDESSSIESSADTGSTLNEAGSPQTSVDVSSNESVAQNNIDNGAADHVSSDSHVKADTVDKSNNGTTTNVSSNDSISQQNTQNSHNAKTDVGGASSVSQNQHAEGARTQANNATQNGGVDARSSMTRNESSSSNSETKNQNNSMSRSERNQRNQSRGSKLLNNARGRVSGVTNRLGQAARAGAKAASAGVTGQDAAKAGLQIGATLVKGAAGVSHKDTLRQNNQNQNGNRQGNRQQNTQAARGANTVAAERQGATRGTVNARRTEVQKRKDAVTQAQTDRVQAIKSREADAARKRGEVARGERDYGDNRNGKPFGPRSFRGKDKK